MVVKIPKKLEMKSLLPAPRSPLPAHVLAFPSLTFDVGLELDVARSSILTAHVVRAFAFVSLFVVTLCTHKQQKLIKDYTTM
jgi:hypothetical protein